MRSKLKMAIEYLNPVQYVLMCDSCCFFHLLSPLVSLFSDCYGGWQICPVAIFVGTIYFKTHICPGLCMSASCLWWIHPVTRASLPLTSPSQEMTAKNNPPQSLFCSTHPPQPSDMFGCGYHLPVSQSHVVSSGDLMSQIGKLLTSGTERDMYSAVEACTATCGAHSKDWWKQLPYWHNIIVFVFEVHRMRRTHLAVATGGKNNLSQNNYVTLRVVERF